LRAARAEAASVAAALFARRDLARAEASAARNAMAESLRRRLCVAASSLRAVCSASWVWRGKREGERGERRFERHVR